MMAEPDVMSSQAEHQHETPTRLLLSATLTLTLSILGSSVLPVPFAFSRTGVFVGLATSLVVAYANAVGCSLLLRAARKTGHGTFEGVAQAAGGPLLKVCVLHPNAAPEPLARQHTSHNCSNQLNSCQHLAKEQRGQHHLHVKQFRSAQEPDALCRASHGLACACCCQAPLLGTLRSSVLWACEL